MYFIYILYSISANKYYVGHTSDPFRRLEEHNTKPFNTYFTAVTKENMEAAIARIDAAIKENPDADKKIKQKLNYAKAKWPAALERYEVQEKIMGNARTSYSKTDTDATFMRMKEDHMLNGQLKPAYNLQVSSNNQYIANYSIHQATTDGTTLISHLDDFSEQHEQLPNVVTAAAGYGSEENYTYLEEKNITRFVKYTQFYREQNTTIQKKRPFAADKLHYNKEGDYYICPIGQQMKNTGTYKRITSTGFVQHVTKYVAQDCSACPLNGACHKSKGNRIIEVNHQLNRLKQKANQHLLSEGGIRKRRQRCQDIEPVFANIKNSHEFKRFMLRGKEKVMIEAGLFALAHNLRRKVA